MDLKEFDALLHDAELRLKRLKALYEQWFQGIERIEPTVARKDLERAFSILNRNKPRNTAARFRLQQLVARYQVYTTFWGRIARQIEEGTYERDIRRVRRKHGRAQPEPETKAYELDLDEDVQLDDDLFGDDEIANVLSALEVPKEPPPKRGLGVFSPFAMAGRAAKAKKPEPSGDDAKNEPAEFKKPVTATFGKPRPVAPREPASREPAAPPEPTRPQRPTPTASRPGPTPPRPANMPAPPSAARPPIPPPSPPRPTGARPPPPPRPPAPPGARPPAPPRPAPPARPAPPRPPAGRPPTPPRSGRDEGLDRLYTSYVAARRRNNEQGDVAYDKLASSVRSMTSKLRQKHGDKKIDFEVVVRNGKVGLKPKIG